ncbi:hypothetical protein [Shewanella cyperi]|uniref:hypothetical protein n=1 Tax=Shewanella cyperi TaxID=2814292 RepID=UPI001A9473C3|nr:hypothetical protein [Shewanella cyperi]QSX42177.1 hypothetical protein JYB84_07150 [Shewanella cyperi]
MSPNKKALTLAVFFLSVGAHAGEAEQALANELVDCAAYYQISSEAISAMKDAPQMQVVGERLKQSATDTLSLAGKYAEGSDVDAMLKEARERQVASLAGSSSLATLMAKYKDQCKDILANPEARLDYWVMSKM